MRSFTLLLTVLAAASTVAFADPIAEKLFPPEAIMKNQAAIGLAETQRSALIKEVQKIQSDTVQVKFDMDSAQEKLVRVLEAAKIDEKSAIAAAEKVMQLETQMKKTHLSFLIRIKNLLTPEQQAKLRALSGGP